MVRERDLDRRGTRGARVGLDFRSMIVAGVGAEDERSDTEAGSRFLKPKA